ncbi:unnamed protein product [Microthlaspi erraticum]|uniref:MULE transposase domain-containing protein n=1 Tax=Microthlaspi erraticum TaxID=1685480 RepID=A0A6D2IZW5_9BRAS|nr:unnamed protein product [Microthlaspi erraticum]
MALAPPNGGERLEFDDEEVEREEFQLEELLREFQNEPSIQHRQLPETDDEAEDDGEARAEAGGEGRERMVTRISRGDGSLYKDQTFFNGVAFKESVLDYALKTRWNISQYRYDKDKIGFECAGRGLNDSECMWQIYASILPKDKIWRVRKFVETHTCQKTGQVELVKVPVIARLFKEKIRREPEYYMPMKIEELVMSEWGIVVSRPQCQAGRNKALKWISSEYDQQFARLKDYAAEIVDSNPGSSVEVCTTRNDKGEDVFSRFYVCFDVLRKTWKDSCRPLIGLDGCFLKERIKGQLLVALGRDADNAIYPIAWGVVEVENNENWQWFVQKLKVDLDLKDGDGFIAVSDRHKGLVRAIKIELPKMEHRKCVRHIYGNLKKKHKSKKQMKSHIWRLAWSYNEAKFQAFYKLGNYCEDVENNSTESFNASINKAREKPFIPMLEAIARLAMARIAVRSRISHDHTGKCTPYVIEKLAKQLVDKDKKDGAKKKWDITGIPCKHAHGVMLKLKIDPEDYVCYGSGHLCGEETTLTDLFQLGVRGFGQQQMLRMYMYLLLKRNQLKKKPGLKQQQNQEKKQGRRSSPRLTRQEKKVLMSLQLRSNERRSKGLCIVEFVVRLITTLGITRRILHRHCCWRVLKVTLNPLKEPLLKIELTSTFGIWT